MKKNGNKKRIKLAVISVFTVFVLVMAVWIGSLLNKNYKLSTELEAKQNELAARVEENTELEALIDEGNETALMEAYARKSRFVYSDERVYINGS